MLSLILPTYNEAENIPLLLPKIVEVLKGVKHEVIIVDDDSPDGTWKIARELAMTMEHVQVIRRMGRRGLSSAVIEGFLASKGDILAVMDADGQHDMGLLTSLVASLKGGSDIAIGSRYVEGGSVGQWDERRAALSRLATNLAIRLCKVKVKDPMSGFFALKRDVFEEVLPRLNPKGFKILLDLLIHVPSTTDVQELPFSFGVRTHGESKLSRRVQIEFIEYLYEATIGRFIPLTFIKYCLVGALGVAIHVGIYMLIATALARDGLFSPRDFTWAMVGGIEAAILFNFILNNAWTFAQARLRGWRAIGGFIKFNAACAFGAIATYSVSVFLFLQGFDLLSVLLGATIGVVWNYTMNRLFTWRV